MPEQAVLNRKMKRKARAMLRSYLVSRGSYFWDTQHEVITLADLQHGIIDCADRMSYSYDIGMDSTVQRATVEYLVGYVIRAYWRAIRMDRAMEVCDND